MKTSAIRKYNVAVTEQSGRVGNVRYIQRQGETYVRSASNSYTTNSRTERQMLQRLNFASLTALWSLFGTRLRGSFQNKEKNQSDANAFVAINQGKGAYMTKTERQMGRIIPLPVMVAQGSLRPITCEVDGAQTTTNIRTPGGADANTVASFSKIIVENNTGFEYGDQITYIDAVFDDDDAPVVDYIRLVLSKTDQSDLPAGINNDDNYLAFDAYDAPEAVCCIHTNSKGKSSNATFVLANGAEDIYASYTTADKFEEARTSYGTSESNYLAGGSGTGNSGTTVVLPFPDGGGNSGGNTGGNTSGKLTLTVQASPGYGGTVTGGGQYTKGATATLTATPSDGYVFEKWSDLSTQNPHQYTVNSTETVYALFKQQTS